MKPYYQHAGITIYHGDCREVLPTLYKECGICAGGGCENCGKGYFGELMDVFITDPPYGVELGTSDSRGDGHGLAQIGYANYQDTFEQWHEIVPTTIEWLVGACARGCSFAGKHLTYLPAPSLCGGIYCPAGVGRNPWGFTNLMPIFFYGTDPRLQFGASHTVLESTETSQVNGHPCPKPEGWMRWLVKLVSLEDETVLDPFMGSGTTLRAAKDLGRKAIGIEIEEKYCEIAAKRLSQEVLEFKP
ncbi:MAG: site-specific DNA-methyltransferase [Terriglobia bacterium]|jgi:site-specific DNA-methyltransferase (adenine-specific)